MILYAFPFFEAVWRRLFGGWMENIPVISNRSFQHVANCTYMFFLFQSLKFETWEIVYSIVVIEGLFWSIGHGCCYDCGRHGTPDERMIGRYKKLWWCWRPCAFLFPEKYWYGNDFDLVYMTIRYTVPTLFLIPVFGVYIVFMGSTIPIIYNTFWILWEKGYVKKSTQYAEVVSGFMVGLYLGGL